MTLPSDTDRDKSATSNPMKGSGGRPESTKKRGITADGLHGLHGLAELLSNDFSYTEVPQSCAVRAVFALASPDRGER